MAVMTSLLMAVMTSLMMAVIPTLTRTRTALPPWPSPLVPLSLPLPSSSDRRDSR